MRNRIIGILLGIILGMVILVLQSRMTAPKPWNLLPENEGQITSIALQYTSSADELMLPVYMAFLSEIASDVAITAVCGDASDARRFKRLIREWGIEYPERVKAVDVGAPITGWCKDRFLVAQGSRNTLIYPTVEKSGLSARINDALVAPSIANAFPKRFTTVKLNLNFDAGDFLQTREHVIVSDVLWLRNGKPHNFMKKLSELFTQDIVYLRGAPDHHIGMYVALVDEKTVIVGDPSAAMKLWFADVIGEFNSADFSADIIDRFDQAAVQLKTHGFNVIRVPLVVLGERVYITYTNGIFETRGERRIAYIPTYGISTLDKAGISAFESAGFKVHPIPVGKLYKYRGTIGCMFNVLERE
ncbi:MAG: hypothetical protein ACYC0V_06850 [Armatimonadota bacterium]